MGSLTKAEHRVFDHTVRENTHLKHADIPMLELYAMAYVRAAEAKKKAPQVWERECRVLIALSTKLRITQQATTDPKTAARRRAEAEQNNNRRMPWDR
jgi:hypothetical protein